MSFQDKIVSFGADWAKIYTATQLKEDLPDLDFKGKAGWYFTKTDTILITYAGPAAGTKFDRNGKSNDKLFHAHVWNRPAIGIDNPCEMFNAIVNAPVQRDDR